MTIAALVVVYSRIGELQEIKELFTEIDVKLTLFIIGLQLLSYYFLALNYRDVLAMKGTRIPWRQLFPMTFVIQFLNQVLPSATIAGQVFFVNYLKKLGISIADGIGRAVLEFATLYSAFGILFISTIIIMLQSGIFDSHWELQFFIYLFSLIALSFLLIFFALQRKKRSRIAQWLIGKIHIYFENNHHIQKLTNGAAAKHLEHVKTLFAQMRTSLNIKELITKGWLFGAATLWQLLVLAVNIATLSLIPMTLNAKIPVTVVIIVFTLTKFISMIAFIPGALGVFEGSMTLMFISFGVPSALAISVTLIFRAFTFWLPMPVGWVLYRRMNRT